LVGATGEVEDRPGGEGGLTGIVHVGGARCSRKKALAAAFFAQSGAAVRILNARELFTDTADAGGGAGIAATICVAISFREVTAGPRRVAKAAAGADGAA
jgi:hypothetical protein